MKAGNLIITIKESFWTRFFSTLGVFVLLDITKWIPLRFWGATSGEHFVDTKQILNSVSCVDSNADSLMNELCSNYIYGEFLIRSLDWLHIGPSVTAIIGYLFLAILAAVLARASYKSEVSKLMYLGLILSPPIILLAERANFDVLMLMLVFMAGLLSSRDRAGYSTVLLAMASVIKFYTTPLMLLVSLSSKKRIFQILTFIFATAVSFQVVVEIYRLKQSITAPKEKTYNNGSGFGFDIWSGYLPRFRIPFQINEEFLGYFISTFVIVLLGLAVIWNISRKKNDLWSTLIRDPEGFRVFEFFLATHLSCYFAGISIDYRLIFIVCGSLSYLSSVTPNEIWHYEKLAVCGLLLISLWCTDPSDGLQFIGDLSLTLLTLLLTARAFQFRFGNLRTRRK